MLFAPTFIDSHIAWFLPQESKPTMEGTSVYRLNEEDIKKLTESIVKTVKVVIQGYFPIKIAGINFLKPAILLGRSGFIGFLMKHE